MDRQKQILQVFQESDKDVLTKSEIIELGRISYYHSTRKHVGFTLSRMVNNGTLERVKRGVFRISGKPSKYNKYRSEDPNQIELFKK